jgi:hypothetical protein
VPFVPALSLLVGLPSATLAKPRTGASSRGASHHSTKARTTKTKTPKVKAPKKPKTSVVAVARDERGRIQRSAADAARLRRQAGFPSGRPGYVIDRVVPLACGGVDAPIEHAMADKRSGPLHVAYSFLT